MIVGVYGPACHLLTPNPDNMIYSAGVNIRVLIQSCDINGMKCEQGGSLFQGTLTRRSEDSETLLAEEIFRTRNITIDDDLDGKYSTKFKVERNGTYDLAITVDGLHIDKSPFEIFINPLEPSIEKSYVEWLCEEGESIRCTVNDSLTFRIHLLDDFGNEILDPLVHCGMTLEKEDRENKTTFHGSLDGLDEDGNELKGYNCTVCPQLVGNFRLHVWVHDVTQIAYRAIEHNCAITVHDYVPISTEICTFKIPESSIVGEDLHFLVSVQERDFERIRNDNKFKVALKPLSHSLSPRALVRDNISSDPLQEIRKSLSLDEDTSLKMWSCSAVLRVAGDYIVKFYANGRELHSVAMYVRCGKSSCEYTEIIGAQQFYLDWQEGIEKAFFVQIRDLVSRNTIHLPMIISRL